MQIGSGVLTRLLLLVGSVILTAGPSQAVNVTVDILQGGTSIGSLDAAALGCTDTSAFTATCSVQNLTVGDLHIDQISLNLDTDPIVNAVIAVLNNSAVTQQYTMTVTLGVVPVLPSSVTAGSVAGGVTDNNGDGATLSTLAGSAFYTALIDGITYQTLHAHSVVLNAGVFDGNDLPTPTQFGLPGVTQPGPAALATIGIKYDFNLTAQDSASFTSVFVVQPVPEPSTALLVGLGLVVIARRARRQ